MTGRPRYANRAGQAASPITPRGRGTNCRIDTMVPRRIVVAQRDAATTPSVRVRRRRWRPQVNGGSRGSEWRRRRASSAHPFGAERPFEAPRHIWSLFIRHQIYQLCSAFCSHRHNTIAGSKPRCLPTTTIIIKSAVQISILQPSLLRVYQLSFSGWFERCQKLLV
jgi:hypothetical protein